MVLSHYFVGQTAVRRQLLPATNGSAGSTTKSSSRMIFSFTLNFRRSFSVSQTTDINKVLHLTAELILCDLM